MAAMSNKERQAAFRARKKLEPFANKHFEGMHAATLKQFLHAVEVDQEAFLAMFRLPEPEPYKRHPRDHDLADIYYFGWLEGAKTDFLDDQGNAERVAAVVSDAKKVLHKEGYFSGLPDYEQRLREEVLRLLDKEEGVLKEAERRMEEWCNSPEGEEERRTFDEREDAAYEAEEEKYGTGWPSDQFPLYQLMDAYKKLLALP
jgi:hypothetical protein